MFVSSLAPVTFIGWLNNQTDLCTSATIDCLSNTSLPVPPISQPISSTQTLSCIFFLSPLCISGYHTSSAQSSFFLDHLSYPVIQNSVTLKCIEFNPVYHSTVWTWKVLRSVRVKNLTVNTQAFVQGWVLLSTSSNSSDIWSYGSWVEAIRWISVDIFECCVQNRH